MAKAKKEKLVLATRLLDLALRCRDILDELESAASVVDWEDLPEPPSLQTNLMQTVQEFDYLDGETLSRLMEIDLKQIEFQRSHRVGEFERDHLADNRFDPISSRLSSLKELLSDCLKFAEKLQAQCGLDASATKQLNSPFLE